VLTIQLAGAITAVVALVGGLGYLVTCSRQTQQIDATLDFALRGGHPGSTDPCLWMFVVRGGKLLGVEHAPAGLPLKSTMDSVARGGAPSRVTLAVGDTEYVVSTRIVDGEVREAAFDERYQISDGRQLGEAIGVAELIGLLAAVVTGRFLAGRAIRPLTEALLKQRQFVADASHELRTPLARLQLRAQLLLRRAGELPGDLESELRRLVDGTRELNEVVDDLLHSARLTAAARPGESVELSEIAAAVAEAERFRATERGVTIELSPAGGPAIVHGVGPALRRMVGALLDNAIRHTPAGGRVRLAVDVADRGRTVQLVVADNGEGFDPAYQQSLFHRFVGARDGQPHGSGLGLALVQEIVHSHGGTVTAAGRPGAGADFTVRLPAATRP
jgi:signal transduction histidine kinase